MLLLTAAAVFGQDVNYNFDKQTDFSRFKTYKWVEIKTEKPLDQITTKQITSAIEAELAAKGLTKTESEDADLYLGYQTGFKNETEITSYNSGWGYGGGWRTGGISSAQTSTILIAALALDIYAPAQKELVWRGIATKTVDVNAKPDKREKNIRKGVAKLLKNYPPKKQD